MIFETRPAVVGHRGFGAGSPGGHGENSLASFAAAADAGVRWVELDARRSSDDELVVWHNPVTADGAPVIASTAAELAAAGIVTLAQALASLPAGVGVDIDVKTVLEDSAELRTHTLLAEFVRHHLGTRPMFVSSFDPSVPVYLADRKAAVGQVPLGLITSMDLSAEAAVPSAAGLALDVVCLPGTVLALGESDDPALAARVMGAAHQGGLEVMVWAVTPAQAVRAVAAGADAVCVDDVPGALAALPVADGPAG